VAKHALADNHWFFETSEKRLSGRQRERKSLEDKEVGQPLGLPTLEALTCEESPQGAKTRWNEGGQKRFGM